MWTLLGPRGLFCDGINRRSFLRIGALSLGGVSSLGALSLPNVLQAEDAAPQLASQRRRGVILIYLTGGLAHQDSFDLKPEAPDEIRGEFKPIDTCVPGIQICEHLPKLAQQMDQFAIVRSLVGQRDEHSSWQNLTGFSMDVAQRDAKPNIGSAIAKVLGPANAVTPAFVDLFPTMQHRPYNIPGPGFLGAKFAGAKADGEDVASMQLRYIAPETFRSRRELLARFDSARRELDSLEAQQIDTSYRQAFDILTSTKLADALNLEKEEPTVRELYGSGSPKHQGDGAPAWNEQFLMAARLIEAGARVVTVAYGFWDTHGNNFNHLKKNLPQLDHGLSGLLTDLRRRGLDQEVTVVVCSEFGRTPKINKDAGRDHWAPVNTALFAGGGLKAGQVIGSTDKLGAYAKDRPVHYRDVLATIYRAMEIDPHHFVRDTFERPISLLPESATPIKELF